MPIISVSNDTELSSAILSVVAGDVIELEDGSYSNPNLTRNFGGYVTIKAVNRRTAIFDDFDIHGGAFVRLEGLHINGQPQIDQNAIEVQIDDCHMVGIGVNNGASFVTIENSEFTHIVVFNDALDFVFRGNVVRDVTNQDMMQVLGGSKRGLIEYNEFLDCIVTVANAHPDMLQMFADFVDGATPEDITIRKNHWYDNAATGSQTPQGLFLSDAGSPSYRNITIEENLIASQTFNSITINGGTLNVNIRNNTIPYGRIWVAETSNQSNAGVTVEGNVTATLSDDSALDGGATVQNNMVFNGVHTFADLFENFIDGGTWQEFLPKSGGPIDFDSGFGALGYLIELQSGGTPTVDTFSLDTQASNGTAVVNSDGTGTYDPNTDFVGADSFVYMKTGALGGSATGTITVTITAPPVSAPDGAISGVANQQISFDLSTL